MARTLASLVVFAIAAAVASHSTDARAEWPDKPIRLISPYTPGGSNDTVARLLAQKLSESLKQSVVVENRAGANGGVGADHVAKSAPDGYTLLLGAISTHALNPLLNPKLPYDAVKDFAPLALVALSPLVLVANPGLPAKDVRDLIALAKAPGSQLNFGSSGNGSSGHLAGELFKSLAQVNMTHVAYKGTAPALVDLIAGRTQLIFDLPASSLPHIQAGKLRPLAVTTTTRFWMFPDLPTVAEAGVPGFEASTWFGLYAPAGTPKEVVRTLNAHIQRALESPDVKQRFRDLALDPKGGPPEDLEAFQRAEIAKWGKVIREAGIKGD